MKIKLDPDIYTQSAINKMIKWFSPYLKVSVICYNEMEIELVVVEEYQEHRIEVINTFMNNILDLSIVERLDYEH